MILAIWSLEKTKELQKNIYCFIDTPKSLTVWITTNWKILQEMGIPDQKQQLEQDREQQTGSKLGKEYVKAVYCHPAYLTYMQSTSWEMPGWMKHKLESRLSGEI